MSGGSVRRDPFIRSMYLQRGTKNGKRVQVRNTSRLAILPLSVGQSNMGAKNHAVLMPDGKRTYCLSYVF